MCETRGICVKHEEHVWNTRDMCEKRGICVKHEECVIKQEEYV